jgi:precorrin-8X/cobalt-precorrin-8 methylmutase
MVDWSAASRPKSGQDSVWVCDLAERAPRTSNPRTRGKAEAAIREVLLDAVDRNERVLIGFDFPYAYPQGLAGALGLGGPAWSAIWEYLESVIEDDAITNANNRFEVAAASNARLPHHGFWGSPARAVSEHLSGRRDRVVYQIEPEAAGLSEWREVETVLRSRRTYPQSTWKLMGAGSVGSQAMTGIPVLSRIRNDPRLAPISRVWPFEVLVPDLPSGRPAIIHAEIWPSLVPVRELDGRVKDQAQVVGLAEEFRRRDQAGTLSQLFAAAARTAAGEEGWILGVE